MDGGSMRDSARRRAACELWRSLCSGSRRGVVGVDVTITLRAAKVPQDRLGPNLLVGPLGKSMEDVCETVAATLHMDPPATIGGPNYPTLARANAIIGNAHNGFVEPLRFRNADRTREVGP